jgi:hypothetical protein
MFILSARKIIVFCDAWSVGWFVARFVARSCVRRQIIRYILPRAASNTIKQNLKTTRTVFYSPSVIPTRNPNELLGFLHMTAKISMFQCGKSTCIVLLALPEILVAIIPILLVLLVLLVLPVPLGQLILLATLALLALLVLLGAPGVEFGIC